MGNVCNTIPEIFASKKKKKGYNLDSNLILHSKKQCVDSSPLRRTTISFYCHCWVSLFIFTWGQKHYGQQFRSQSAWIHKNSSFIFYNRTPFTFQFRFLSALLPACLITWPALMCCTCLPLSFLPQWFSSWVLPFYTPSAWGSAKLWKWEKWLDDCQRFDETLKVFGAERVSASFKKINT